MTTLATGHIILPDPFEEDFCDASPSDREKIITILRDFIHELRVILDGTEIRTRVTTPEFSERCETCAFASCTDVLPGFPGTVYGLLRSITRDKIFACHDENPNWKGQHPIDPERVQICSGFASIRLYAGSIATVLAVRKMRLIREIVPTAGKK